MSEQTSQRTTDFAPIRCVDLFCGVGGLTHGLTLSGIQVCTGIDADPDCRYPYTANNPARFIQADVAQLSTQDLTDSFHGHVGFRMLAGCAPCQPFSTYANPAKSKSKDWGLLRKFGGLVSELRPDFVTMENVPGIVRHDVYSEFLNTLVDCDYRVTVNESIYCPAFGIPQERKRLVLMASLHGTVSALQPTHAPGEYPTVRQSIERLEPITAGMISVDDPVHAAAGLSPTNLKRIRASVPGRTWRDWPDDLRAKCHSRRSGKTFPGVYGRMEWDKPSPTVTTQCFGYGNGRFGHPQQDRAISLREAALLQTFPLRYRFVENKDQVFFERLGRLIGNAVPVRLGKLVGAAFVEHAQIVEQSR